jgi:hypothetical protein
MQRYIIERNIPGAGQMSDADLCAAAAKSNDALASLAPEVQWVHSYVADDRLFCEYLAQDESGVRKHAEISGFPANRVVAVHRVIDPLRANGAFSRDRKPSRSMRLSAAPGAADYRFARARIASGPVPPSDIKLSLCLLSRPTSELW